MQFRVKLLRCLIGVVLLGSLLACSKINEKNYQQIEVGMSREQVVEILGEPTQTQTASLLGIGGESAQWQDGGVKISATFVNGNLLTRSMTTQ
jgi:hypothetical protein